MKFKKGDRVKVIDQEIFGKILSIHDMTREVVIQDEDSEYESPDDELVYRFSEIEPIEQEETL